MNENTPPQVLPIDHVTIDGRVIEGNEFEMGSLQHDVDKGTVTVKFVGVQNIEVIYKYMLAEEG